MVITKDSAVMHRVFGLRLYTIRVQPPELMPANTITNFDDAELQVSLDAPVRDVMDAFREINERETPPLSPLSMPRDLPPTES